MTWFARRTRVQISAHLHEGETVVTQTECSPLGAEAPADDTERTAVLTDRSLYYVVGSPRAAAEHQVVSLPFARMHQVSRRGLALLFFRLDDAQVTWELRNPSFASRAERQFRMHELQAHREWVGGREPAGFLHRAHQDLLARMTAGTSFPDAAIAQHGYVDELVLSDTGDRAYSRAAARRLGRVHRLVQEELQQLKTALPGASTAQHAMALAAKPSPWPEDAVVADDGAPIDDVPTVPDSDPGPLLHADATGAGRH